MITHRMVLSEEARSADESKDTSSWSIYILLCSDGSFYTGISNNPKQRFLDHKNGKGGKYTRSHKPTQIIYLEKLGTKSEALKREAQIKGWSRIKKITTLHLPIT